MTVPFASAGGCARWNGALDGWAAIGLNYPITNGDNLWVGNNGRAEIDFGDHAAPTTRQPLQNAAPVPITRNS